VFRGGNGDDIKGKKIALVYHNSAYGKEPIRTLEELAKKHGFELSLLAVDHPGQEQKSQWLQIRREKPDYVLMWGWGVMNESKKKMRKFEQSSHLLPHTHQTNTPLLPRPQDDQLPGFLGDPRHLNLKPGPGERFCPLGIPLRGLIGDPKENRQPAVKERLPRNPRRGEHQQFAAGLERAVTLCQRLRGSDVLRGEGGNNLIEGFVREGNRLRVAANQSQGESAAPQAARGLTSHLGAGIQPKGAGRTQIDPANRFTQIQVVIF